MRSHRLGLAFAISLVPAAACGGHTTTAAGPAVAAPPSAVAPATPAPAPPIPVVDPVATGMTADGARHICDDGIAHATTLADQIRALKGAAAAQLTYDATLGKLDWIILDTSTA